MAAVPPQSLAQEQSDPRILVVSRDRVLRDTAASRSLREAERSITEAFQAQVDDVKRALTAEEEELTRLRAEMDREAFNARTEAFDQKVRSARRASQRHAVELQRAFQKARDSLVAQLAPILIEVLRARDADIVLDSDAILVAAPSVDVTDEVIRLFDERVPPPEIALPEPPDLGFEPETDPE